VEYEIFPHTIDYVDFEREHDTELASTIAKPGQFHIMAVFVTNATTKLLQQQKK